LAALDDYQRRFPRGVLQQEAAMLRIEALLARGDKATARRLSQRFLEQYPRSALAARVKNLLEE
jgi:outer membrane protein assembly factor BamD (BamD/ComL family)